ncbi:hypothetical protein CAEBREN_16043 [Caenorhabditis brenneri]|uniref:Uncharacterized protein n=1 Tax=Caenorhabditis brenneri TaxID=135651 RepID=G0NFE2_CAEBE|nr:hypothetical protein CAEBREN_16043 [Caenorhabditis brenneri]
MDLKAIVPTAPFFSPHYEVNPFFLSLPVLGNPAVSPMSTMNDGILEPVTSTSCTPSFASSIGGVTNFGTVPISGSSLLLSATETGSTQPTASTGCDPSLESLLATMNNGTIPAPPGSALVLGNGSLPNSQELSESPIKKFPKLFHMGNGLLQPTTPAPNSFGEMPILQKSSLVSEVAPVSSEPVTPAACGLLGSKSSDLNIFGGMPLLENSVLVSETGAKSSILQTTDFSGLVPPKTSDLNVCGTVAVSGDLLLLSATGTGSTQLTTPTTCPPLAAITSETNFFEGMSISENSAHLDEIAKLSSKPTSSTAFTPLAPPAAGANITAANSIPENSALLPAKAISPSMPATLVASAPTAPTVADKRISETLTNSKSSALSSSVTNASLPPTTSAPGASHVPMPDINNFGTMSYFENPPLISAMVNLSSNPASSAALVSLAPIESETSVLTPMPALGNSALQSGTMSMSSGLKTSPGSSLVSISSDTNIFGTMSISDSTALLSALASLSSKPPLSAASAPFGPADASTSALPPTACASIAPIANPSIFPPMPVLDSSVIQSALLILQQQQQTSQPEMFALEKKKKKNGPSTSERSKDHADKKQNNTVQQPVPDSSTPYASSALAHLAALANSYNGLPDKSVQFYSSLPPTPSISQIKKQNKRRGYQNDRRSHTSRPTRPTVLDLLAENNKCVQPILCGTMFSSRPSNQQPSKPKKSPNQRKNIPLIDLTLESDHAGCSNSLQPSTSQRTLPQTASPTWLENVRIVQPGSPFVDRQNFTVPHNLYELPPSNRLAPERQINKNIEFHAVNFLKNQLGIAAPRKEKVDLEQLEREPFDTSIFLKIQDVDANDENYCYTMTGRMPCDPTNKPRTPPIDFKEFFSVVGTEYCPLEEVLEIIKLFKPNEQRFLKHCGQFGQWRYETNVSY